jgi:chemotaxis signal transduction protein/methyl-accepting chemotaxis protein
VEISQIQSIERLPEIITEMPQAPPFVEGVIEYRGKVIPLIDLRKRLSLSVGAYSKETKVIVISMKERLIGFIVNNVSDTLTIPTSTISPPPPEVVNVDTKYIRGLGKGRGTSRMRKRREEVKERMIILLDLEKIIVRQLDVLVEGKELFLEHQIEDWEKSAQMISDDAVLRTNLPIIVQYQTDRTNKTTTSAYQETKDALRRKASFTGDYADIMLVDTSGKVILTTSEEERDEGTDISSSSYFKEGKKGVYVSDIFYYEPEKEKRLIAASPVKGENNQLLSVLLLEINIEGIDEVMKEQTGLGETGEIYIVGKDKLMRTDSRFTPNTALKQLVDTKGVRAALEGKNSHDIYKGYQGKKVLGSYRWMPEREWALVAVIDASEAFASVNRLFLAFIIILVLVAIVVIITAYLMARQIASPVLELSDTATMIAEGDLTSDVEISGKYEVGVLARVFAQMTYGMRSIVASVRDAAAQVSALAEQVSAGSKQISDGVQTQASATAETTAATQEMAQSIDEVAKNTDSLASSVEETSASIRQMAGNIQAISSSSSSISLTIEETTASINEMAASIKDVSENTQNTAKFTDTVNESAVLGNDAVKQTEEYFPY